MREPVHQNAAARIHQADRRCSGEYAVCGEGTGIDARDRRRGQPAFCGAGTAQASDHLVPRISFCDGWLTIFESFLLRADEIID